VLIMTCTAGGQAATSWRGALDAFDKAGSS
jgi:hypothetical protein